MGRVQAKEYGLIDEIFEPKKKLRECRLVFRRSIGDRA